MLPRDDGPVGRTLLDVEDKDRLIAVGTVSIAAGTLAIVFSTRGGTVASVLVWIFGAVAVAAFVALPWSWYRRSLSWFRSRVLIRLVPRRLDRPGDRLPLAAANRWRFTTDGAEVPQIARRGQRNIDHPAYLRSAGDIPPYVRVVMLVACSPLGEAPGSQELRTRFLALLSQALVMELIGDLRTIPPDVAWKSWATDRRSTLRADLTGEDQAVVPVASAVLEVPSPGQRLARSDPRYAELILHADLPAHDVVPGLPDWRRRLTRALVLPGALARFLQDLGLAVPGGPPAQFGVLLQAWQAITEIVSPGMIPALPASSPHIVNEFTGFAVADPAGRTAEETAGQMMLDLSERVLHLDGSQAEMAGETVRSEDPAAVPARPSRDGQIDRLLAAGSAGKSAPAVAAGR